MSARRRVSSRPFRDRARKRASRQASQTIDDDARLGERSEPRKKPHPAPTQPIDAHCTTMSSLGGPT